MPSPGCVVGWAGGVVVAPVTAAAAAAAAAVNELRGENELRRSTSGLGFSAASGVTKM